MNCLPKTERQVKAFEAWLVERGHTILQMRGEWELLRWSGAPDEPPRIMYTNKRGVIANWNNPAAAGDWIEYSEDHQGQPGPTTKGTT